MKPDPSLTELVRRWEALREEGQAHSAAFFILGTSLWGRCYLFAAAFFAASLLMPLTLSWSPLLYGVLWGVILLGSGLYLRRRGVEESQHESRPGRGQETSAEVR